MDFIKFTCPELNRKWNANKDGGIGGWDKLFKLPKWKNGNKLHSNDVYEYMCNEDHKVNCVLTGGVNNITVFDFDVGDEYYKCIEQNPQLKEAYTIKTTKGFHIYCKYNPDYKTTANKQIGIDIRNDSAFVFGQGTKTEFDTCYEYYCGDKIDIEMPYEFYKLIVPKDIFKSKPIKKEKNMCKPSLNEDLQPITDDDDILLQYCECIDIADVDNYNTWLKLIWSLHGHKEIARKLSRMGNNFQEESFQKKYEDYKDRGLTIKTFYEFAKKGNRNKYFDILSNDPNKKEIEEQDEEQDEKFLDICNMEDTEIAHTLFIYFGDNFVKEGDNIYYWDEPNKKWICDNNSKENNFAFTSIFIKDVIKNLTTTYLEKKDYYKLKENEDEENMISRKLQNYWKKSKELLRDCKLNPIVKWFIKYLVQRNDKIEFDANCDLFAFENKVYDFTIKDFREIEKHDYISMTTQIDYKEPEQEEVDKVKEIIENIIPDVHERRTYISLLYNAMTGYSSNKLVFANGSGGNGKGVLHGLFNALMGKYGIDGHNSLLTSDIKSGANTELNNINKKRWVNFTELDTGLPLNVANCKKLSGGDYMSARGLWSDKDKCNVNSLSVFIEVNNKPNLNGVDTDSNALARRVIDFGFKSMFTENEDDVDEKNHIYPINRDYTKDTFKKKHACALFKYITNYEGVEEINVCDSIKEASSKYLLGNDAVYTFVWDIIERVDDKDSIVKISDLYDKFKESDCFHNMTKNEKRTYNKSKFLEYIQRHSKFKRDFQEKYQNGECMERYGVTLIRNVLRNYKMRVDEEN